jgi:hypothetical protein
LYPAGNVLHRQHGQFPFTGTNPLVERRFVETADLSHELQRSCANFFDGGRRIEIEEGSGIPADGVSPHRKSKIAKLRD